MAYAAVTSLMETLSLHFLQSQPRLPLDDLEAQMRDGNENLGLLQQILEDMAMKGVDVELDEAASSKGWTKRIPRLHGIFNNHPKKKQLIKSEKQQQQLAECSSQRQNACWDSILVTSRLKEVAEVKQKMISLHQNLGLLQDILEKSEIGNDDAARVMKGLVAEIRDASFKAEEMIEMELTTIYLAKGMMRLRKTACLLRLHEIFKEAEKQADYQRNELIRIQTEYQLIAKAASSKYERFTNDVSLLGRMRRRGLLLVKGLSKSVLAHKNIIVSKFSKKASKFDDSRMVGCHKVFEKILDQLTQQSTKTRQVVSIVGMGGIGKTTLAHKVYEHSSITSHFDKRAWVTVSQEYNVEQMLRCLLSYVTAASRDELHKRSTDQDQLAEMLYKCLKGQRYLIVIDDIWSTTAWDSLQRCFPDDNNGSRILLTSRLREVAEYASSGNSPLSMPFLDADESWNLYCKVFGKTEFLSVFEQMGRGIVKKCEGLPLAITVVASLLSKTEEEEEKWENVAKSVIGESNDACSRILYLSYNQLPHHLKACFLYLGIFWEDYEIPVKKLVRLWAAEGFLRPVKDLNLEEVAMKCLKDLVDRSLVIVCKQSYNGEMKRIKIHDLLRDLCLRETRRENLFNVIANEELSFNKGISQDRFSKPCRWVSIAGLPVFLNNQIKFERFEKSHSLHLGIWYSIAKEKHLFSHLKLLRVVNIEYGFSDGDNVLNVLANLVHLRYFALSTAKTFEAKLFEHWNLQSFIVGGDGVTLNSSEAFRIWKMPLLKNFCIGRIISLETSWVVHRNLENISWLDSKLCKKDLFTMIPNLKKLGVDGGYYNNNLDFFHNFVGLKQLEKLSIRRWMELNLVVCSIPWAANFLPNLKKLSLLKCNLQWSNLRLISMLPNLEVLKLIDACGGLRWETSDGGFRRLKRLVIRKAYLDYWNAVGDHFPMLKCLEISDCYWLEEIPRGFADITTLALIKLSYCWDSLVTSAKWIQDEQRNSYGNDGLLVRSENIRT